MSQTPLITTVKEWNICTSARYSLNFLRMFIYFCILIGLISFALYQRPALEVGPNAVTGEVTSAECKSTQEPPKDQQPTKGQEPAKVQEPTKTQEPTKRNILFVESSGKICLTRRQLCSVESAALHNPHMNIIVFVSAYPVFTRSNYDVPPPRDEFRDCNSTFQLQRIPNVRYVLGDMFQFTADTPLHSWLNTSSFLQSQYSMFHAGDVLRAALLKKYGGIFLDLDCMVLKPLDILKNAVGKHESNWLEAGVVAFELGHPFSDHLIDSIIRHYKPADFVSVGPTAVTDAARQFCNMNVFSAGNYTCAGNFTMTIRPAEEYYAITGPQRMWFYNKEYPPHLWKLLNDSLISHVFDNEDGKHKTTNESIYHILAKEHCPMLFKRSIDALGSF